MHWDTLRTKLTKPIKLSKKWKGPVQSRFLIQLAHLLQEGFSLDEALKFLEYLFEAEKKDLEQMRDTLGEGRRFDECLRNVGYSETNTSQIYLSMQFGSFEKACASIGEFLTRKQKQQKKMQQMMMYPAFLFTFVLGWCSVSECSYSTNCPAWYKKNNSSSLASFIGYGLGFKIYHSWQRDF